MGDELAQVVGRLEGTVVSIDKRLERVEAVVSESASAVSKLCVSVEGLQEDHKEFKKLSPHILEAVNFAAKEKQAREDRQKTRRKVIMTFVLSFVGAIGAAGAGWAMHDIHGKIDPQTAKVSQ